MMTPRRFAFLALAGVAVIALALWVSSRRHLERTVDAGQQVLPSLAGALNTVTEVRLIKGDGTRTSLKKSADDWLVSERGFPADSSQVRKLLIDLSSLQVVEQKTREPANYAQIGVEDVSSPKAGGTLIEIVMPAKTLRLVVGKQSGTKSSFVRIAGEPQSLLVTPQVTADADPRRWLDRDVLDLSQSRVKEVAIAPHGSPAYVVTRPSAQQGDFSVPNLPKGRELVSVSAANPQAGALTALQLDDVRRSGATPADADHAKFTTFDGLTLEVSGHKDGDRRLISLAAQSAAKDSAAEAQRLTARFGGWDIEIPSYKYDALFKPLEELLKKPPEPPKKAGKGATASKAKAAAQGPQMSPAAGAPPTSK